MHYRQTPKIMYEIPNLTARETGGDQLPHKKRISNSMMPLILNQADKKMSARNNKFVVEGGGGGSSHRMYRSLRKNSKTNSKSRLPLQLATLREDTAAEASQNPKMKLNLSMPQIKQTMSQSKMAPPLLTPIMFLNHDRKPIDSNNVPFLTAMPLAMMGQMHGINKDLMSIQNH